MKRVAIIGGGFAGAAFAVHLSRHAPSPLDIIVVERRERVGGGLAHSPTHSDHRLNAPDVIHPLYPEDDLHFRRWLETTGRLAADPEAWYGDGRLYPRRRDFGAYVAAQFVAHMESNPSGSTLAHHRAVAHAIEMRGQIARLELSSGHTIEADRCVIAVGQEPAVLVLPGADPEALGRRWIADPFASGALEAIDRKASVLVLGTGLTAADVVTSLVGQGHLGPICCVSRHGLRPETQNPASATVPLWERMAVQPPAFVAQHGLPPTIRALMRIVRQDARDRLARGQPWHGAIDDVRDAGGEIWRGLSPREKSSFLRHVKPYYDVHRFRIPPQTLDILQAAERRGQLTFEAASVVRAEATQEGVDVALRLRGEQQTVVRQFVAIVSCVGISPGVHALRNPFVRSCLQRGLARSGALGFGLDTDDRCRLLSASGSADPVLYAIGGMTIDRFGETPAAIFLLRQTLRMLPAFVSSLA